MKTLHTVYTAGESNPDTTIRIAFTSPSAEGRVVILFSYALHVVDREVTFCNIGHGQIRESNMVRAGAYAVIKTLASYTESPYRNSTFDGQSLRLMPSTAEGYVSAVAIYLRHGVELDEIRTALIQLYTGSIQTLQIATEALPVDTMLASRIERNDNYYAACEAAVFDSME